MPNRRSSLILGLMLATPMVATAGVHLWYDENGQAVYSQLPPEQGQPSVEVEPPPPPAESPEVARQRLQQRLQQLEDYREDQALAQQKADKARAERKQAKERCKAARENLTAFEGRARALFRKPDGSIERMSEQEREAKSAKMRKIIEENCR